MNERLKSTLKYAGVFLLGLLIGAFLIETLEIHLRPAYRDSIRSNLKAEQEFSASRATRENRLLEAAFHRWAAVNAESDNGFRVFREQDYGINDDSYLFPLAMLGLKWMSSADNVKKGKMISEGLDRGRLAVALEAIGQTKEAEKQWQQAQQLMHRSTMQETKKAVYQILELQKTDTHMKAEDVVLGDQSK